MLTDTLPTKTIDGREVCLRIGVHMGGNDIKFGATTLDADRILTPELVKRSSLTADGPTRTIEQMLDGIGAVLDQLNLKWSDVADISVTVPCPCTADGSIIEATNLGTAETNELWKVPFGEHLAEAVKAKAGFDIPVFACNDANAAGQDDDFIRYGDQIAPRTSVFITTGTGLGGCVVVDGAVYFGGGQAGELGHIKPAIPENYRHRFDGETKVACGCGSSNCVEARASLKGLTRRVGWAISDDGVSVITQDLAKRGETVDPATVQTLRDLHAESPQRAAYEIRTFADQKKDPFARWLLEDWAIMIGTLFANLAPTLHPNQFIIGGGLTEMSDDARNWFIEIVRRVYHEVNTQESFETSQDHCQIHWSASTDQGWRGAILMRSRRQAT